MALYSITAPDGNDYEIEGPEGATQNQIIEAVKRSLGSQQSGTPAYDRLMQGEPGFFENVGTGLASGFVGTLESGATGLATLLDEDTELTVRDAIQEAAETLTPEGGDKDSITYGLANAVGSVGGFAAPGILAALAAPAGAATAIGTGMAAGLGVASQAGEASERARAAGVPEDVRNMAIMKAAPVGVTEVLPLGKMTKFMKVPIFKDLLAKFGPETVAGIRGRIVSAATTGGLEAAQEVTQELVQNLIEQGYNPEQLLSENLGPAAGYGGGAGAIIQGMLDLFVPAKFRKGSSTNDDKKVDAMVDQLDMFGEGGPQAPLGQGDLFGGAQTTMQPPPIADPRQGDLLNNMVDPRQPSLFDTADITQRGQQDWETAPAGAQADMFNAETTTGQPDPIDALNRIMEDPVAREQAIAQLQKKEVPQKAPKQIDLESVANMAQAAEADTRNAKKEAVGLTSQAALLKQASDTETIDAKVAGTRLAKTEGARRVILDNVLETNKTPNDGVIARNFQAKLTDAGFGKPTPTAAEITRIKKARDIQFAEPLATKPTPTPTTASTAAPIEALVPEKKTTTQPEQLTLEGIQGKKRAKKSAPPVAVEQQAAAEPITDDKLTELGIAKAAPLRTRIAKDPTNYGMIKDELTDYANNPKVPAQTKHKVTKFLEGENADQIEAFGPRGAVLAPAKKAPKNEPQPVKGNEPTGAGVGTESGKSDTLVGTTPDVEPVIAPVVEEPAPPSVGTPDDVVSDVDSGAGQQPAALGTKWKKGKIEGYTAVGPDGKTYSVVKHENGKEWKLYETADKDGVVSAVDDEWVDTFPTLGRAQGHVNTILTPAERAKIDGVTEAPVVDKTPAPKKPKPKKKEEPYGQTTEDIKAKKSTAQKWHEEKIRVVGEARTQQTKDISIAPYVNKHPTEKGKVTESDYKTVIGILGKKAKKPTDPVSKKRTKNAKVYLNDDRRLVDNLTDIGYDVSHGIGKYDTNGPKVNKYTRPSGAEVASGISESETIQEDAFRSQKGGQSAIEAMLWVRENLGPEANATLTQEIKEGFDQYALVLGANPIRRNMTKGEIKSEAKAEDAAKAEAKANAVIAKVMEYTARLEGDTRTFTAAERAKYEKENPEKVKATADKIAADISAKQKKAVTLEDEATALLAATKGMTKSEKEALNPDAVDVEFDLDEEVAALQNAINDLFMMPQHAIDSTDLPLHPAVRGLLEAGELKQALELVTQTAPNKLVQRFASGIAENIGDTKVKVVKDIKNASGKSVPGKFSPDTNAIHVVAETATLHTLLHEASHAVLSHTIDNKSHPLTKKLNTLYEDVKDDLSSHYGSTKLQEFVAEAISNDKFKQELASLYAGKKSDLPAWRQFLNAVTSFFKKLLKIPNTDTYAQLNDMLVGMMSPAPEGRGAGELYMRSLNGELDELVDAYNKGETLVDEEITKGSRDTFKHMVKRVFAHDIPSIAKQAAFGFMQSYPLADATTALGIHGSHDMHSLFLQYDADVDKANETLDAFTLSFEALRKVSKPEVSMMFDRIRAISTRDGVDPSKPRSTYKSVQKQKSWDDMQPAWKALGKANPEWHLQYQRMKEQYSLAFERLKGNLDTEIMKIENKAVRKSLKEKIFKDIYNRADIDPYFPLWRTGKFWLQYSATIDGQNETVYEIYKTPDARLVEYNKLQEIAADPNNADGIAGVEQFEQTSFKSFDKAPPSAFVKDAMAIFEKMEVDQATKDMFMELFIRSLPETSFAKRLKSRTGDPGFELDSLETFRQTAYDLNRQAIQLKYGRDIRSKMDEIRKSAKVWKRNHPKNLQNRDTADVLVNEWEMRSEFSINPDADWKATAARNANRFAFAGTIGFSPSSAIVNLTQIPMVVFPYLAGKTSLKTAYTSLTTAGSLLANAGIEHTIMIEGDNGAIVKSKSFAPSIDNYYIRDPKTGVLTIRNDLKATADVKRMLEKIRPMIQFMSDNAQLSRSVYYDTLGVELSGKSKNIIDKATAMSAYMFHITERTNRQIAIIGSYLNELERLETNPNPDPAAGELNLTDGQRLELAKKNAFHDAQYTNGGAVLSTAPRWAQKNLGRVAMMFKSFGIMMYTMQGKLLHKMTKGKTEYERKEAMRQFFGVQGMVALMSGVQGVTLYGMIAMVANMFMDDDEEDFETVTRKYLGEGIYKGGINQLSRVLGGEGVDVASRIGLSNLIIASNRYNFDPSVEKSIVKTIGGPFYGYTSQIGRGIGDFAQGEYQRGFENILPAAFRNAAKASMRYPQEGIQTRRGDPIMGEVGNGLLAAQFFGFAPAEYTRNQERAQSLKGIDRPVNERRTKLLWLLYRAERFGEDTSDIYDDIIEFNDKNPDNMIDGKSIKASMKRHMETDLKMFNGVLLSPKMDARLRELGDGWDQGLQMFK